MTVTRASFPWCIIWTSAAALLVNTALLFNLGAHAAIVMVMVRICGRMSSTALNCSSVMLDHTGAAHVWFHARPCVPSLSIHPPFFLPPFSSLFSPSLIHLVTGEGIEGKVRVRDSDSQQCLLCAFPNPFICLHSSAIPLRLHCFGSLTFPRLYRSLSPPLCHESEICICFGLILKACLYRRRAVGAVGSHLMVCCVNIRFQLTPNILLFRLHSVLLCWQLRGQWCSTA